MNLCGPRARDILAKLTGADISRESLPFMGWLRTEVAGVPVMIFRLGFLGEASFEMHCPASQAEHLWQAIVEAGQEFGLRQAGLETQFICRLEKGHALPGLDIDGNTTMFEAHFGWLWDRQKTDTVGGPMLRLLENEPLKCRSIGFAAPGRAGLTDGDLILREQERLGFVTSTRYSPVLDQTIGLALVELGGDREAYLKPGGRISVYHDGAIIEAVAVKTPFYDPAGERMKS
jgi:sarcosine oxidase subunit alpha